MRRAGWSNVVQGSALFTRLQNPSRRARRVFGSNLPSRKIHAFGVGEAEADSLQICLQLSSMLSRPFHEEHTQVLQAALNFKRKRSAVKTEDRTIVR